MHLLSTDIVSTTVPSLWSCCRTLIYRQLLSFVFSRNGQLHCMVYLNVLSTCYYACLWACVCMQLQMPAYVLSCVCNAAMHCEYTCVYVSVCVWVGVVHVWDMCNFFTQANAHSTRAFYHIAM